MGQEHEIPSPGLRPALDRLGLEFLAGILEVETARHPENLAALADLGHALTRLSRFEEGLAVDREMVRRRPEDPTAHYNLACSLALLGRTVEALDALERSVALGYDDAGHLLADEDLRSLRAEARFQDVLRALGTPDAEAGAGGAG